MDGVSERPSAVGEESTRAAPQDWETLVTDGHVRGHRLLEAGRAGWLLAVACGAVAVYLGISAATGTGVSASLPVPPFMVRALYPDPAHYVSVPGVPDGADYRLAWLSRLGLSPQSGLTTEGWNQLLRAVQSDVLRYGDHADSYVEIPKLAVQPLVTRPGKVFSEHAGQLAAGVVSVPPPPQAQLAAPIPAPSLRDQLTQAAGTPPRPAAVPVQSVNVVAWVQDRLAWTVFAPTGCSALFGPSLPGCALANMAYVVPYVADLDPANNRK